MREYNVESPNQGRKRFNSQVRRNTLPIWVYYLSMPGVLGTETHTNKYLVCRVHTPGHLHKKICLSIFFSRGWLFLSARRRVLPQSLSFSFFVRLEPHTSLAVPLSGCEHLFYIIKGAVSRDFLPCLSCLPCLPSGALINRIKWFCLKIRFCGDIRKNFDSA